MTPCPFCGGAQGTASSQSMRAVNEEVRPPEMCFVTCTDCGARGPVTFGHDSALAMWNQRGNFRKGDRVMVAEKGEAVVR